MSVHGQIGKRTILIVMSGQRLTRGFEVIEIFLCPPIRQTALRIELAALVIKAVADFVADDCSNRTVVVCSIRVGIEEWRLEKRGWKIQRILNGKIHGVHRLRRHPPLSTIDRLVKLLALTPILKQLRTLRVCEGIAFDAFDSAILLPLLGLFYVPLQQSR